MNKKPPALADGFLLFTKGDRKDRDEKKAFHRSTLALYLIFV